MRPVPRRLPPPVEASGEHEFEAAPGLPEPLPSGERLLWQGAPDWRALAVQALHVRKVAAYFGVLLAWRIAAALHDGQGLPTALLGALWLATLGAAAVGLLAGFAWLSARTTLYTLTDRRVVMRIGVVLSVTFNLPFTRVHAAALRERGATGDITLQLDDADRIAYGHLWPHARPWQLRRTQPMLRALRDAESVAQLLADAVVAAGALPATPAPVRSPTPQAPGRNASPHRPLAA